MTSIVSREEMTLRKRRRIYLFVFNPTYTVSAGAFSLACEGSLTGGFAKTPDAHPDPLHTYMSISGFALTSALLGQGRREEWIKGLCPCLGLSVSAADGFTTDLA